MYEDAIIAAIVIGGPMLIVLVRMVLRHKEKMANLDALPQKSTAGIDARLARQRGIGGGGQHVEGNRVSRRPGRRGPTIHREAARGAGEQG